jgi:16S rRNA (guanine966-N2)-methyltransferase
MNRPPPGLVRIIGGTLRGSKLPVPDLPGLRPSGDRARETLFNWLQHEISGRHVLDLFAGSGALGFEAASRGAAEVVLLERDGMLAQSLRDSARRLKVESVRVEYADALGWLARAPVLRFDLAFIDPPLQAGLWDTAARALSPWLADRAWVYVELARNAGFDPPPGWSLHRQGQTREVRHLLFRTERQAGTDTLGSTFPGAGIVQA